MPCDIPCNECQFLEKCGGNLEEGEGEIRECSDECPHFDLINMCCWQSGSWGLCFDVEIGDYCHLGYKENDYR